MKWPYTKRFDRRMQVARYWRKLSSVIETTTSAAGMLGKSLPGLLPRILVLALMPLFLGMSAPANAGMYSRGACLNPYGAWPNPFTAKPNPYGALPNPFTVKPNPYGALPNPFTVKPNPYETWPNPFTVQSAGAIDASGS